MKISKQLKLLLLPSLFYSGIAAANEFTSESSVTVASQYLFRGFDMTQEDPALQGDYIVSHESGFWFGAWASNYDFGTEDGVEIDLIGGFDMPLTEDVTLGVGFTEYTYTGEADSTTELYVSLSYSQFSLTYYDDVDLETVYLSFDAEFALSDAVSIALHAAEYDYDVGSATHDYSATLSYTVNDKVTVFATFSNNDINEVSAEDYIVAGLSYSF